LNIHGVFGVGWWFEKRENKGTAGNPCQRPSSILNRSLFPLAGLPEFYR
jgi:hypothetical protein